MTESQAMNQAGRRQLLQAAAAAVISGTLAAASTTAEAFCGEPYPVWAYNLDFEEGLVPFEADGFKGQLFSKRFPLVLVPSAGLTHSYLETLEAAASDDRRVVLWDPIGTGTSSALPAPPTAAPALERQLQAVLQFLELKSYHLLGHGTGAAAALSAAASQSTDAGAGALSVTLASPLLRGTPDGYAAALLSAFDGRAVPVCLAEAVKEDAAAADAQQGGDGGGAAGGVWEVSTDVEVYKAGGRFKVEVEVCLEDAAAADAQRRAGGGGGCGGRVGVLYGANDPYVSKSDAQQIRDAAEGALAVAMPSAGHLAHLERREEYLGELLPFLQAADAVNAQAAR
ncbi:Alpha/Beta hydrolase protein [Tribonema minus]|uniref:Alpha/Beta hydrolase protein n=1 Tax=Tribonema minus TaxID=303371 RepID=A0A835YII1_9STRA|nr:Alpha/Beta hydrolase protein [Tribonema minus]